MFSHLRLGGLTDFLIQLGRRGGDSRRQIQPSRQRLVILLQEIVDGRWGAGAQYLSDAIHRGSFTFGEELVCGAGDVDERDASTHKNRPFRSRDSHFGGFALYLRQWVVIVGIEFISL